MVSDRQSAEYVIPTELKSFGLIAVLTLTVLGIVYLLQFRDIDGYLKMWTAVQVNLYQIFVPLLLLVAPLLVKLLGLRMIQFTKKIYMPVAVGSNIYILWKETEKKGDYPGPLFLVKSTDNGHTFGNKTQLVDEVDASNIDWIWK